jgi:hypothetical protein
MNKLSEEIDFSIELLKEQGCKEDNLKIAPVSHVRCFVPCQAGYCVCVGYIDKGQFCIVSEGGYNKAMRCKQGELDYLQGILSKKL